MNKEKKQRVCSKIFDSKEEAEQHMRDSHDEGELHRLYAAEATI